MKAIFQIFLTANKYLVNLEKILLCTLIFSMVILSFGQVVARNLFSTGFVWAMEVVRIEVLWITVVGAALATEYRQHIKIDFLYNIVGSPSTKKAIDFISQLFAMCTCFVLFVVGKDYLVLVSSDSTATMIQGVPDWTFKLIIPYCFFVMSVRCLFGLIKIIQGTETRESEYSESFDDIVGKEKETA